MQGFKKKDEEKKKMVPVGSGLIFGVRHTVTQDVLMGWQEPRNSRFKSLLSGLGWSRWEAVRFWYAPMVDPGCS